MNLRFGDLWRWRGTLDRGAYAFWGLLLAFIKFNYDRFLVSRLTGIPWSLDHYWSPGDVFWLDSQGPGKQDAGLIMLAASLPFMVAGILLTLKRLRAAGLPPLLLLFFFPPGI